MNNLINIKDLKKIRESRLLDIKASFIALETCLSIININNLPELIDIKININKKLKELERLEKNER